MAAALAPHEQPAHHGVAHGAARGRHAAPVAPPRRGRGRALEAAAAARAARVDRGGLLVLGVNGRQPALGQDLKRQIHSQFSKLHRISLKLTSLAIANSCSLWRRSTYESHQCSSVVSSISSRTRDCSASARPPDSARNMLTAFCTSPCSASHVSASRVAAAPLQLGRVSCACAPHTTMALVLSSTVTVCMAPVSPGPASPSATSRSSSRSPSLISCFCSKASLGSVHSCSIWPPPPPLPSPSEPPPSRLTSPSTPSPASSESPKKSPVMVATV